MFPEHSQELSFEFQDIRTHMLGECNYSFWIWHFHHGLQILGILPSYPCAGYPPASPCVKDKIAFFSPGDGGCAGTNLGARKIQFS